MFIGHPPTEPPAEENIPIPVIPLVAPLVLSLVMALVLSSAIALMMGILGPVMVLGGWIHQRKITARKSRILRDDFEGAKQDFAKSLKVAQNMERNQAEKALPSVLQWTQDPLWRVALIPPRVVRIGEGVWTPPSGHALVGTGNIVGMPAGLEVAKGVALIGGPQAHDVWRNLVVQWLVATGPGGLDPLPLPTSQGLPRDIQGVSRAVWVSDISQVPAECGILVVLESDTQAHITMDGCAPRFIRPDRLSHAQVVWALEKLTPVHTVDETPVLDGGPRGHLIAQLSATSPALDLVREGPHAVVWGATGSGKSVTVCSLVLSLTQRYEPRELVCVVIDFKGGAGLRPLSGLPHTIGMVTDLEPARSDRARSGLVAEMQKRERIMAKHQVADVANLGAEVWCPRLLVVVDEVAWLCANSPEWADTLADIAQRGRSLGVHIVLSTQRVTGVLPRALMANVSLRMCGRVSDEAEVLDWMPGATGAQASGLRHLSPGRLLIEGALGKPAWHCVTPQDVPATGGGIQRSQWRVWSEDLPEILQPVSGSWALADCPEQQNHLWLSDNPMDQGSAVVVGDIKSGRTNAAYALAAQSAKSFLAPAHPAKLWQCLRELQGRAVTLVIDDADAVLHLAGAEGETCLMDALEGFEGKLVMTIGPRHRLARGLARLAPGRVVLPLANSDDESLWGVVSRKVPGRARHLNRDIQLVFPVSGPELWAPGVHEPSREPPIVVTETPERWGAVGARFVGSADQLAASWHTLSAELSHRDLVSEGVSHRDIRHSTAGRVTFPPLEHPVGWCWVWRGGVPYLTKPVDLRGS